MPGYWARDAHGVWYAGTVIPNAPRVIIVWLYNNTGKRAFAAALFHMTLNVTWQLFPVNGSYFDPHIIGSISALMAVVIIVVWGSRTLT